MAANYQPTYQINDDDDNDDDYYYQPHIMKGLQIKPETLWCRASANDTLSSLLPN